MAETGLTEFFHAFLGTSINNNFKSNLTALADKGLSEEMKMLDEWVFFHRHVS